MYSLPGLQWTICFLLGNLNNTFLINKEFPAFTYNFHSSGEGTMLPKTEYHSILYMARWQRNVEIRTAR